MIYIRKMPQEAQKKCLNDETLFLGAETPKHSHHNRLKQHQHWRPNEEQRKKNLCC